MCHASTALPGPLQAMGEELGHQEAVLDRVTGHVDKTHLGLSEVQASAERTLGKKGAAARLASLLTNARA